MRKPVIWERRGSSPWSDRSRETSTTWLRDPRAATNPVRPGPRSCRCRGDATGQRHYVASVVVTRKTARSPEGDAGTERAPKSGIYPLPTGPGPVDSDDTLGVRRSVGLNNSRHQRDDNAAINLARWASLGSVGAPVKRGAEHQTESYSAAGDDTRKGSPALVGPNNSARSAA